MAAISDSEDESFVELGRALPFIEGEGKKKPISLQDASKASKDAKGQPRFHGAFTGGFSAGYFNSVGSREGWTPSTFVSSRSQRQEQDAAQFSGHRPEDFMDDEDFGEHGIAPRKFSTSTTFTSEEHNRKRRAEAAAITRDAILPAATALVDLIVPEKIPMGIKLLRKMGWKEGQGIGPRVKRKKKKMKTKENKDPGLKVYGCMLPPSEGDDKSESSDSGLDLQNVTFAPKDVAPISLTSKDNVHGLGYRGLDPRSALPSTHVNLFEPPPVRSAKGRKGIRGQAFGVGALEDEDEDIYVMDSLSNYDQTMEMDDSQQLFGWTAPGAGRGKSQPSKQHVPVGYVGKLLEGFTLSAKPLPQKKTFPPPSLPQGFKPFHKFKKTPQQLAQEAVGETSATAAHRQLNKKLNAVERGLVLGEMPIASSVFDLIPSEDKRRVEATKEALQIASSRFQSAGTERLDVFPKKSDIAFEKFASDLDSPASGQETLQSPGGDQQDARAPLFHGSVSLQPFRKDPAKQERYERYQALVKQGVKDPYEQVTSTHLTEWERQRERDEFTKAAKIYRPLSNMMATRFTRGAFIDDTEQTLKSRDVEAAKSDQAKAAEMKMFGKLTHEEMEWHPHNLLCKRFNIPNPYPGSEIVGLLGVKRDKFSVFNFLSVPTENPAQKKSKQEEEPLRAIEASNSLTKQLSASRKKPGAMSIFSILDEQQSAASDTRKAKKNTEENVDKPEEDEEKDDDEDKPDLDLFRAIFKNSDSESSAASEQSDNESEDDDKSVDADGDKNDDASPRKAGDHDTSSVVGAVPLPSEDRVVSEPETTSQQIRPVEKPTLTNATPEETPCQPSTDTAHKPRQKSRSRWGGSIFDVLDQLPPWTENSGPKSAALDRLSPPVAEEKEQIEEDVYGPALPPAVFSGTTVTEKDRLSVSEHETDRHSKHKHQEKDRERSRHRHKKEKKKKSKHKKDKKKKKEKKRSKRSHSERPRKESSGSKADSETDSSDGSM